MWTVTDAARENHGPCERGHFSGCAVGSESSPLRGCDAFAAIRSGSWCIRRLAPVDRRLLSRTNGRYTVLGPFGLRLLLLTTIGSKSGQRRQSPLMYLRDGDRLFLFGSNLGQSMHPAWSGNLLADPHAWSPSAGRRSLSWPPCSPARSTTASIKCLPATPRLIRPTGLAPTGRSGCSR